MKYYVVSDIHGFYTELITALENAGFFSETKPHKLIVCGDLLDRGEEANQLIEFMLKLMEEDKLIYILGNHEELFDQCLYDISKGGVYDIYNMQSHHYHNGTWQSMLQISGMSAADACKAPGELVRSVKRSDFYRKLLPVCIDYFETKNYIFTHGWIPCFSNGLRNFMQYKYDPDWRKAGRDAWYQARWYNGMNIACKHHVKEPNKTIVCGHYHTSFGHAYIDHRGKEYGDDADFSTFYADGIIALDAATVLSHTVNCIVIED